MKKVLFILLPLLVMASCCYTPEERVETVTSRWTGEEVPVQVAEWHRINIDGKPSIQSIFTSQEYGILEISYNPSMGFRFGWFDNHGIQKPLSGSFSYPITITHELVDEIRSYNEGRADFFAKNIGEEFSHILVSLDSKNNYYFYKESHYRDISIFKKHLDDGTVTWIDLTQFIENDNGVSDTDIGGEYVHYLWGTQFVPGEFTKATEQL